MGSIVKSCSLCYLRKEADCQNAGLATANAAADPKAKAKKGAAVFPVLQVGGDPFGDGLSPAQHYSLDKVI